MDSVSIVNNAAASGNNVEMITSLGSTPYQNNATIQELDVISPSIIDLDQFLNAAADGNIEPFNTEIAEQLNLIVTPIKNTVLHINIISEKVSTEFVEEILGICPSLLLQVNAQGDTPLHVAAKFEHVAIMEVLIKHAKAQHTELESGIGAARQMLRMTNNKGNTSLHEAVRNQDVNVVRILVKEDPDFSYPANDCGETPLYIAAETGFFGGVVELLRTCSSATHEGPNGKTALHATVRRYDLGLTRHILEKKKSLTKEIDDNGWTPLHCAAYYGCFDDVHILLEFDKSVAYIGDKYRKMTPLHLAASQGHTNIIREIILFCPDCYELVDDRGWNVLHFAMASLSKNDLCRLLKNSLIKKLAHEKDAKGNTPLHVLATCTSSMDDLNFFDDIVDQVIGGSRRAINWRGRLAVNRRDFTVAQTFHHGSPELQQEISALSEDTNVGPYTRGVIRNIQRIKYEQCLSDINRAKEPHLVVSALIATVTFAAAFTLPGGYKSDEGKNQGTAILSKKAAFQSFVITDAIAMVFSLSAVFMFFITLIERFKKYWYFFELGIWFTVVAMGAMVIAFVTGTYAVLAPSLWLAIVTCFIGLSFFLIQLPVGFRLILDMIKDNPHWKRKMKSLEFYVKSTFVRR